MVSRFTLLTVLFSFLMGVSPAALSNHDHDGHISTIRVVGTGEVSIAPDIAMLNLGVVRDGKTAREALSANNGAMSKVLKALKLQGIAAKDIQTSGFNISPRYYYPPKNDNHEQKPPTIVGYQVSNNLTVRIRDLTKVGNILDLVVTLGVNTGGNIQFTNDDPKQALKEARKAAMADAMDKAETLIDAVGADLGRILDISENSRMPRPMPMAKAQFRGGAMMADAAVPVEGGENVYSVTVNVNWEIDQ